MSSHLTGFTPNPKQVEALKLFRDSKADRILLYGGSRSGKSVLLAHVVLARALMFAGSKHGIYRATLNTCRSLLFQQTVPEVLEMCWPGECEKRGFNINKQDSTITFANGSVLYFRGLDENNTQRIRGAEYGTVWLNECNEIRDYHGIMTLASRMNHTVPLLGPDDEPVIRDGKPIMLRPRMFFDCNPQFNTDWEAQAFKFLANPVTGIPHPRPERWRSFKLSPRDNLHNPNDYETSLRDDYDGIEGAMATFVEGEWRDNNPMALFQPHMIKYEAADLSSFARIIVAIDPSVVENVKSDETGIIVAGLDRQGRATVLADRSGKYGPDDWAKAAIQAQDEFGAHYIVAETNQGGDLIVNNLRQHRKNIDVRKIHASKGKISRADPVSTAYRRGRVVHAQQFKQLEAQMFDFENVVAKRGQSPDRVDALVYALTDLLGLNGPAEKPRGVSMMPASLW